MSSLLTVKDLRIAFSYRKSWKEVVSGINFDIEQGEILAVVGESGSGKSVTAKSITRLLPSHCRIDGSIRFEGNNLIECSERQIRSYRGSKISYIFQEPSTSLHPQYTIGAQIKEVIAIHQPQVKNRTRAVLDALDEVGINDPDKRINDYPFQMSGGMLQRVMIAIALACRSKLLIADEPTTALDVTIQNQILKLVKRIQKEHNMAVMLITHNFGIVDGFADRLIVMYKGDIVEEGITAQVLKNPKHEYTKGLIACIPRIGERRQRLISSFNFES